MNLVSLTQKRQEHVRSCQLNGDHSHQIIANLYSDNTHFFYELLQNAQDAEATHVSFTLDTDRLITTHNGRPFTYKDVEAITTIGSSTKANEANKIGKFGAGFKSVFSISKTPEIYSHPYYFHISDYIIPQAIEPLKSSNKRLTTVILPFNKEGVDNAMLYRSIERKLTNIGKNEILFLSNLQRIEWAIGESRGFIEKSSNEEESFKSRVTLKNNSETHYFELYVRDFTIDKKPLQIKIAFALDEVGSYKSSGSSHPLFVFFPTVIQSNVHFLIHAPYKTTPNRETIDFSDPQNITITKHISALYAMIIMNMANVNKLNPKTMTLFPLVSHGGVIAESLFQTSIDLFNNTPLILTNEQKYVLPVELFSLQNTLNRELFYTANIHTLFEKFYWLHPLFNESAYRDVRQFLSRYLGIQEVSLHEIVNKLEYPFLMQQSNVWIEQLYEELGKKRYSNYLSDRPLARLSNGEHIPFKSSKGEIQVYLNTGKKSQFQSLSHTVCTSKTELFLSSIGVKEPTLIDEIKTFILPTLLHFPTKKTEYFRYYKALKKVHILYDSASAEDKNSMIGLFKKSQFLCAKKGTIVQLQQAESIYLPLDTINDWFEEKNRILCQTVHTADERNELQGNNHFVLHDSVWKLLGKGKFLFDLSCKQKPTVYPIPPHIDVEQKTKLRHTPQGYETAGTDFKWDGLYFILTKPIDQKLSLIMWTFLCDELKITNILRGYYRWQSNIGNHEEKFDSKICVQLQQTAWLFDKEGNHVKPSMIKIEDLSDIYFYDTLSVSIKEYLGLLGFKTNKIEELEKEGYRVISKEESEEFEAFKRFQEEQKKQSTTVKAMLIEQKQDTHIVEKPSEILLPKNPAVIQGSQEPLWESEVKPTVAMHITPAHFQTVQKKDFRYQTPKSFIDNTTKDEYRAIVPQSIRKSIGQWSEEWVHHYLQNFCQNHANYSVQWMNEQNTVGYGYDFVLLHKEKEVRYIEVKGIAQEGNAIKITKAQWGFAKYLYDLGEGKKYSLFVVKNPGQKSASLTFLNNPVQLWMEGKLMVESIELI